MYGSINSNIYIYIHICFFYASVCVMYTSCLYISYALYTPLRICNTIPTLCRIQAVRWCASPTPLGSSWRRPRPSTRVYPLLDRYAWRYVDIYTDLHLYCYQRSMFVCVYTILYTCVYIQYEYSVHTTCIVLVHHMHTPPIRVHLTSYIC